MIIDEFGISILEEHDVICGLYSGKVTGKETILMLDPETVKQFNQSIDKNFDDFAQITEYKKPICTLSEFDSQRQNTWFMPEEYKNFDIANWLLQQCQTLEQLERVNLELALFTKIEMLDLLRYLKYLVDFMREKKITWGVGRGSSVASYCLFLIGIHKIDSIRFGLDITDFIKEK